MQLTYGKHQPVNSQGFVHKCAKCGQESAYSFQPMAMLVDNVPMPLCLYDCCLIDYMVENREKVQAYLDNHLQDDNDDSEEDDFFDCEETQSEDLEDTEQK